mmetsp:Transcript_10340/g.37386  ORF Transcript_10340/g.37386 Transcript_10340/m.37386 type:complete len:260 (-) Transcript_10340:178-957(-)
MKQRECRGRSQPAIARDAHRVTDQHAQAVLVDPRNVRRDRRAAVRRCATRRVFTAQRQSVAGRQVEMPRRADAPQRGVDEVRAPERVDVDDVERRLGRARGEDVARVLARHRVLTPRRRRRGPRVVVRVRVRRAHRALDVGAYRPRHRRIGVVRVHERDVPLRQIPRRADAASAHGVEDARRRRERAREEDGEIPRLRGLAAVERVADREADAALVVGERRFERGGRRRGVGRRRRRDGVRGGVGIVRRIIVITRRFSE